MRPGGHLSGPAPFLLARVERGRQHRVSIPLGFGRELRLPRRCQTRSRLGSPAALWTAPAQRTRRCVREGRRTLTLARLAGSDARAIGASRGRGQARAVLNWRRARMAVTRKITTDMLGVQRRFQTLFEMFEDLSSGRRDPRAPGGRLPVLLLLGGGMAAGKSTVREIIGYDDFWSKARCAQDLLAPPARPKALRRRNALMSARRPWLVRRAERMRP